MISLGTLGGPGSNANGINNLGEIVGQSQTDNNFNDYAAFLYVGGTMYNLNSLIPANSGWVLQSAAAINDCGQIVGDGLNPDGLSHAFLLTPNGTEIALPEPSISTILPACAGLLFSRRRSRDRMG
jgi:probable HAF family extracellular repeat protein